MSDIEGSSYNTAQMDIDPTLDDQGNDKTPNQLPFSVTIKALDCSARKWKTYSANSASTIPTILQLVQVTTTATNQKGVAELIAPLIINPFSMDSTTAKLFLEQLLAYFVCIVIANESCLGIMSAYSS